MSGISKKSGNKEVTPEEYRKRLHKVLSKRLKALTLQMRQKAKGQGAKNKRGSTEDGGHEGGGETGPAEWLRLFGQVDIGQIIDLRLQKAFKHRVEFDRKAFEKKHVLESTPEWLAKVSARLFNSEDVRVALLPLLPVDVTADPPPAPLHPSWEASRRQRRLSRIDRVGFTGGRVVFTRDGKPRAPAKRVEPPSNDDWKPKEKQQKKRSRNQ
ncbi:MAG: hypothetical protein Q8P67_11530 [archaeon]|nr:hypothetical protein [archaeon]